jgi:hypothetical protein
VFGGTGMATQLGLIVQLTRSRFAPHFHQITVAVLLSFSISSVLEFFQRHCALGWNAAHATLR